MTTAPADIMTSATWRDPLLEAAKLLLKLFKIILFFVTSHYFGGVICYGATDIIHPHNDSIR